MLTKTVRIINGNEAWRKYNTTLSVLVTTWKFLGIPIYVEKIVNP